MPSSLRISFEEGLRQSATPTEVVDHNNHKQMQFGSDHEGSDVEDSMGLEPPITDIVAHTTSLIAHAVGSSWDPELHPYLVVVCNISTKRAVPIPMDVYVLERDGPIEVSHFSEFGLTSPFSEISACQRCFPGRVLGFCSHLCAEKVTGGWCRARCSSLEPSPHNHVCSYHSNSS